MKKDKIYTISDKKLAEIKEKCKAEACEEAFILVLGLSVMTISDHMRDLWFKTYPDSGTKCREEQFTDYVLKLYHEYEEGIFSLQDVLDCLKDECGLTIEMNRKDWIL